MKFYHQFLGFTFLLAVSCRVTGMEFFIKDFPSFLRHQLPIILVTSIAFEVVLGYAAQALLSVVFQSWVTPEVSYGLGFIYLLLLFVFFSEKLEAYLQLQRQEMVAPRH
jgi:CBS domain containing-hemolysin-like protein